MHITRHSATVTATMTNEEATKLASELTNHPQASLAQQLAQGLAAVDALTAERYAARVLQALKSDHPMFSPGGPREIQSLKEALAAYAANPYPYFEMIIDHPGVAHWKLVPHHGQGFRLAVVCCRPRPTGADVEVERHMNSKLADISL